MINYHISALIIYHVLSISVFFVLNLPPVDIDGCQHLIPAGSPGAAGWWRNRRGQRSKTFLDLFEQRNLVQLIGLREKLQENPIEIMGKSLVSCNFSLKPIN